MLEASCHALSSRANSIYHHSPVFKFHKLQPCSLLTPRHDISYRLSQQNISYKLTQQNAVPVSRRGSLFRVFAAKRKPYSTKKAETDRNYLKAKNTVKQLGMYSEENSTFLDNSLVSQDEFPLGTDQAIGLVVSAQANYMRVIVKRSGNYSSKSLDILPHTQTDEHENSLQGSKPVNGYVGFGDSVEFGKNNEYRVPNSQNGDDPCENSVKIGKNNEYHVPNLQNRDDPNENSAEFVNNNGYHVPNLQNRDDPNANFAKINEYPIPSVQNPDNPYVNTAEFDRNNELVLSHNKNSEPNSSDSIYSLNSGHPSLNGNEPLRDDEKSGTELLCVVRALLKKIKRRVLVGDEVLVGRIDWASKRGMIENVFQRKSELTDPHVANVDHLLVLFSLEKPMPEAFSLTRFLVEAESNEIPFTLVFNKVDLVSDEDVHKWRQRVKSWGYSPIFCSIETYSGLASLASVLKNKTSAVVGPSGVGKSSLINALHRTFNLPSGCRIYNDASEKQVGETKNWFEEQRVGEISAKSGRGKHTTRNVTLLPLPNGGFLTDTPGFSQPSLMKVTKSSLGWMFPEIRGMVQSGGCAFNDCLHLGEPGCAVKGDWERYPFYIQLLDELKIREDVQLKTVGTKREGDFRYKLGKKGVRQAEPRLNHKRYRRASRKRMNQGYGDELDDDMEDYEDNGIEDSEYEGSR